MTTVQWAQVQPIAIAIRCIMMMLIRQLHLFLQSYTLHTAPCANYKFKYKLLMACNNNVVVFTKHLAVVNKNGQ